MVHRLVDSFLKDVLERHAKKILGALFPKSKFRVLSTQLDKEIIVRSREVDKAILIRTAYGEHIVHFEFYKRYTRKNLRKTFGYAGALTAKYDRDVTTIWLLVKPPSKRAREIGLYQTAPFGAPTNQFSFMVVKLWELREAILAGKRELKPLVPLLPELVAKPDLALLHRQRELIAAEQDPELRAEMLLYALAFGKRHFQTRVINEVFSNLFEENRTMLKEMRELAETPVLKEIIQEWVDEKVEKRVGVEVEKRVGVEVEKRVGVEVEKQQALALQEALLDVLAIRFGKENGRVRRMVLALDNPKKLKAMHRRALRARSLAPIVAQLQKA